MSENKDALYTSDTHPHSGDPRVDPRARKNRQIGVNKDQVTLDSFVSSDSSAEQTPQKKLQKETYYTVKPGIVFTTAPRGSEPGSPYAGRFEESTRIRVLSQRVVSGIASVYAEFTQDGETKTGWVAIDDFRNKKK